MDFVNTARNQVRERKIFLVTVHFSFVKWNVLADIILLDIFIVKDMYMYIVSSSSFFSLMIAED